MTTATVTRAQLDDVTARFEESGSDTDDGLLNAAWQVLDIRRADVVAAKELVTELSDDDYDLDAVSQQASGLDYLELVDAVHDGRQVSIDPSLPGRIGLRCALASVGCAMTPPATMPEVLAGLLIG